MTKTYQQYMDDIENGIAPPDYISTGGEDSCDVCGGSVTWPPTGEPCQGCCDDGCSGKIHEAWRKKTDVKYWHEQAIKIEARLLRERSTVARTEGELYACHAKIQSMQPNPINTSDL